jgi:chromosome partitioning protein
MRRLAIINQKGGVGKTTTAANLSAALARLGHRVLMIDLDPQAHLSLHFGVALRDDEPSAYTVLAEDEPIRDAIRNVDERLTLLPAQIDLAGAEVELAGVVGREVILREALQAVEGEYDFTVLDCPPSLGVLTLNGLSAANEVVVPLQPHFLALQGIGKLFETVALVAQRINPEVRVTGVVICMHEQGTRLAGEVLDDLRSFLTSAEGTSLPWSAARIFSTIIRRNIRLAECPSHGKSIFDYAPHCNGADDYMELARELLDGRGPAPAASESPVAQVTASVETKMRPFAVAASHVGSITPIRATEAPPGENGAIAPAELGDDLPEDSPESHPREPQSHDAYASASHA